MTTKPESLQDFLLWRPPFIPQIIGGGLLPRACRMIMYGQAKTAKSLIAQYTAFALASGTPWFRHRTVPSRVLMIQLELPRYLYHRRVVKYVQGNEAIPALPIYFVHQVNMKVDKPHGMSMLDTMMETVRPDVLIIDPLYKVVSGHMSDTKDIQAVVDNLDVLLNKHNCALIIIAHERKSQVDDKGLVIDMGAQELLGSNVFTFWFDTLLGVKLLPNTDDDTISVVITPDMIRHAEEDLHPMHIEIARSNLKFRRTR